MKKALILFALFLSGCSTVKQGVESLPYYEPTTEHQQVQHTMEHIRTADMLI